MSLYTTQVGEWFSVHVGIKLPQYALPFIDFDIHGDVPLYIDSYAVTKDTTPLGIACHNAIVSYCQALLDTIRSGDSQRVAYLIRNRLREPKEIYLGVGKSARTGMGLGSIQEGQVVDATSLMYGDHDVWGGEAIRNDSDYQAATENPENLWVTCIDFHN